VQGSWFYKPLRESGQAAFYRSLKSALHIARDKAAAKLQFVDDISCALSSRVEFPAVDIPNLMERRDYRTLRPEDIDNIAAELRDYWGLSDDPIDDLLLIIENAGIAVGEDYFDSAKLDGISKWFPERPVVLLAKDKNGGVRRRFDAAHELGHMVLHRHVTPEPRWKVSIGAMIKRAQSINLISSEHERNLWKYYSYRRWRGNEPHDEHIHVERPYNLKAATEMVAEEGVAELNTLVDEIGLSPDYLHQLTGASEEVFGPRDQPRPKLMLIRGGAASQPFNAAND
jgi:Zn-dependent peptidase ImmA (M78 family)